MIDDQGKMVNSRDDPVLRAYKKLLQDRSRMMIRLGLWRQEDVFLFSREDAQATVIHYRDVDFDDPTNGDEPEQQVQDDVVLHRVKQQYQDAREQACEQKRVVDLARLEKHLPVIGLLLGKHTRRAALSRARREVRRWQRQQLCSRDYIQDWSRLLTGPLPALLAVLLEDSPKGVRLRQNSPFWLILKRH